MRKYLRGVAVALLLSGSALATAGTANAQDNRYGHDQPNVGLSIQFGDVAVGYRDGYMDSRRNFHRWNDDGDYRAYRSQHADNYHDWNHDRGDSAITIGFGGIAFGYRDGYWDTGHHWHHWRHRNDYRSYRDQSGSNYQDTYHYREDNNGWRQH